MKLKNELRKKKESQKELTASDNKESLSFTILGYKQKKRKNKEPKSSNTTGQV